jgi:hypothetical protein
MGGITCSPVTIVIVYFVIPLDPGLIPPPGISFGPVFIGIVA